MPGALEGVLVLDLGPGVAAAYCTKLLAGLGAQVIKVEPPATGDSIRAMPPFKDDVPNVETSTVHLHLSMAKKSVTLSLETEAGRDLLRRLIDRCDILVESYSPGALEAWGLDYESLTAARPELIVTSITPFGQDGPYAQYKGNELVEYSAGGYTYLTGLPERKPIKAAGSQAEYQGGLHAAAAAMAALLLRDVTGLGDHLDVSIVEAVCFSHAGMAPMLNDGVVFRRQGARLLSEQPETFYPSTILPCKDGYIHVHYAPADPALLGLLTETPRLSDPELWEAARGHADEIDALLGAWLAQHDRHEAVRLAQELRHPFAEVLTPADLLDDPQFVARGYFTRLDHPVAGAFEHLGPPINLSDTPWRSARAPLLGEHNVEVYCDRLGLSPAELRALQDEGVV